MKIVGNIIIPLNKHIFNKYLLCTRPYLDVSGLKTKIDFLSA